jgi:predicted nucleic acid-binding protein
MRRAYVDACLLIYWVEDSSPLAQAAKAWVARQHDARLCVSALVRLEVLVKPTRAGDAALVQVYEKVLIDQEWLAMGDEVFAHALALRAHHGLKTPDALHLATALHHGCTEFWTNDDRLKAAAGALAVNVLEATA